MCAIYLNLEQIEQIKAHAEKTYPEECCGLLVGKIKRHRKILWDAIATENSWNDESELAMQSKTPGSKSDRFSIAPSVLLKWQKKTRDRHLSIIGTYHSHPDSAAIPSEFDRACAWQQYSYIIVSVREGRAIDVRSWAIDETHQFQPEEIVTTS
jgi:proteasome lid subunit RPN8/RPN11